MADAKMHWDAKQSRWYAMYRRNRLYIKASKLGGTNRTDTVVAANRWFEEQKVRIDAELSTGTNDPIRAEYLAELDNIQSAEGILLRMMKDPNQQEGLAPIVESLRQKKLDIKKALGKKTLPPLPDSWRNPLNTSSETLKEEVEIETEYQFFDDFMSKLCDGLDEVDNPKEFRERWREAEKEFSKHWKNAEELRILQKQTFESEKEELGLIDEYERGKINQQLREQGIDAPQSKKLEYHLDRFVEYQYRRHQEGKIVISRARKIENSIKYYRKWSSISIVDKIGTKDHIDAYYRFLFDQVIAKKMEMEYAKNLFGDFKMLIGWLDEEEVIAYPNCLLRKKRYPFPVKRAAPESIPLEHVRKILDIAPPRLKLFILLTLNCGFGASEIGQMKANEYDSKSGRITHKRSKTNKHPNAPTVCYQLWPETKELLDQEIENKKKYPTRKEHSDCLLLNQNGNPLWYEYIKDERVRESDSISNDFKRFIAKLRKSDQEFPKITYYQFRKTSASLIYNEPKYRSYHQLWLSHAPDTVAEIYYVDTDKTLLDGTIAWLHDQIFGIPSNLE